MLLLKCKKGTILDFVFIALMLFIFGVVSVVMYPVLIEVNDGMAEGGITGEPLEIIQDVEDKYVNITDGIFLFILIGLSIATLIGALMINTHPAFYFIMVGLLVFFAILNGIFGNAFAEIANSPTVVDHSDQFLIINFVMQNFPLVMLVISIVIVIVLFSKGGGI